MNRKIVIALVAAVVFQFLVLVGMVATAQLPLWTGTEIRVKTVPVDPRSLFRGNYARLRYEISQLPVSEFPDKDLRNGEVVYVVLRLGKSGLYEFDRVTLDKPESGVFLRGRISGRWYEDGSTSNRIKYGIEAYFAPKEKALGLESDLRDGGVAVLMVSESGRARLKDVIAHPVERLGTP